MADAVPKKRVPIAEAAYREGLQDGINLGHELLIKGLHENHGIILDWPKKTGKKGKILPKPPKNNPKEIKDRDPEAWNKYRGDKDLWDTYSHAYWKDETGRWSEARPIASFSRKYHEKGMQYYSINLSRGSWPYVSEKELRTRFQFVSRHTGTRIKFRG